MFYYVNSSFYKISVNGDFPEFPPTHRPDPGKFVIVIMGTTRSGIADPNCFNLQLRLVIFTCTLGLYNRSSPRQTGPEGHEQ